MLSRTPLLLDLGLYCRLMPLLEGLYPTFRWKPTLPLVECPQSGPEIVCMRKGSPKAVAERKTDGKKKRGVGVMDPILIFNFLHPNTCQGWSYKWLLGQNVWFRSLFMVSNERCMLLSVFWKRSIFSLSVLSMQTIEQNMLKGRKNTFFNEFLYKGGNLFRKAIDFSLIWKYRSR